MAEITWYSLIHCQCHYQRVHTEMTDHEPTKLCRMFGREPDLETDVQNLEVSPLKPGTPNCLFLGGFMTTSRLRREYLLNETRYRQTTKDV